MTWADIKDSLTDIGLWLHLIITMVGQTPTIPLSTCKPSPATDFVRSADISFIDLPTVIASFNFDVVGASALSSRIYGFSYIHEIL